MEKACEILDINTNHLTNNLLKKQYHKLALKYHPDKNIHKELSKERFQEITEAYHYLLPFVSLESEFVRTNELEEDSFDYVFLLSSFINTIIKGGYKELISNIIKDILFGYKKIESKLFEELDNEKALEIYYFLCKYKELLYISPQIIESVRNIIIKKYQQEKVYILKPSLNDLFENKVYKLVVEDEIYYVPLWHNEVHFDEKKNQNTIIVFCLPDLPDNICIDENNNLLVNVTVNCKELFQKTHITFLLDKKEFKIPLDKLYIKREQIYIFFKEGISQIEKDIYNVHKKSDVIVNISIL